MNKTHPLIQWLPYLKAIKPKDCTITIKDNSIELSNEFFDEQNKLWNDFPTSKQLLDAGKK